jgi:hypothetical protein
VRRRSSGLRLAGRQVRLVEAKDRWLSACLQNLSGWSVHVGRSFAHAKPAQVFEVRLIVVRKRSEFFQAPHSCVELF